MSSLLLPSALLWTTTNLKEGPVLWGGCMMLYLTLPREQRRGSTYWPLLGFLVVGLLRPHVALMWAAAIGAAATVRSGRYSTAFSVAIGASACFFALSYAAPGMVNTLLRDGVLQSLGARQESVEDTTAVGCSTLRSECSSTRGPR